MRCRPGSTACDSNGVRPTCTRSMKTSAPSTSLVTRSTIGGGGGGSGAAGLGVRRPLRVQGAAGSAGAAAGSGSAGAAGAAGWRRNGRRGAFGFPRGRREARREHVGRAGPPGRCQPASTASGVAPAAVPGARRAAASDHGSGSIWMPAFSRRRPSSSRARAARTGPTDRSSSSIRTCSLRAVGHVDGAGARSATACPRRRGTGCRS